MMLLLLSRINPFASVLVKHPRQTTSVYTTANASKNSFFTGEVSDLRRVVLLINLVVVIEIDAKTRSGRERESAFSISKAR
jgi:hypothetical protein